MLCSTIAIPGSGIGASVDVALDAEPRMRRAGPDASSEARSPHCSSPVGTDSFGPAAFPGSDVRRRTFPSLFLDPCARLPPIPEESSSPASLDGLRRRRSLSQPRELPPLSLPLGPAPGLPQPIPPPRPRPSTGLPPRPPPRGLLSALPVPPQLPSPPVAFPPDEWPVPPASPSPSPCRSPPATAREPPIRYKEAPSPPAPQPARSPPASFGASREPPIRYKKPRAGAEAAAASAPRMLVTPALPPRSRS